MSTQSGDRLQDADSAVTEVGDSVHTISTTVLWFVWAALLAGGLIADNAGNQAGSAFGRLGSSVALIIAGWMWATACRPTAAARYARLIAVGMTLGALGDFFMAGRLQSLIPLPSPVLGGMTAFGLGHIVYIRGVMEARRRTGLTSAAAMWGSVIAWQLLSVVGWYFVVFLSTKESTQMLIWPALPYSQLLAGTAGVATGLAVQDRRFGLLAVGAGLFLISDLILAWGMFRDTFPYRTLAVWIPYGGGQMLIVYAITTARQAFDRD